MLSTLPSGTPPFVFGKEAHAWCPDSQFAYYAVAPKGESDDNADLFVVGISAGAAHTTRLTTNGSESALFGVPIWQPDP
jgi:hypothetical protein